MCELTLYRDCDPGSITVSNYFIDDLLSDANDCQIKVYLYLIRMLGARKQTNISDIADKFNHTEKDVCRALKYWEKKGILSLDYEVNGSIVGIRLHEPGMNSGRTVSPASPLSVVSDDNIQETVSSRNEFVTVPEENRKPEYSAADLREFKNREDTPQLIFIAETYLKKTLSAGDIRSLLYYSDALGFSGELIDYLLQFCLSRGKRNFAYMDKVAADWADHGIDTVARAREYTSSFEDVPSSGRTSSKTKTSPVSRRKQSQTMFHQFEQNSYDFNSLERQLLQQ